MPEAKHLAHCGPDLQTLVILAPHSAHLPRMQVTPAAASLDQPFGIYSLQLWRLPFYFYKPIASADSGESVLEVLLLETVQS